jgi:putative ABC transport system ATP-binding protein
MTAVNNAAPPVFAVSGVTKSHRLGRVRVAALRGVELEVARGEVVVVAGPSGSGKSTLLNLMGALDRPDTGTVAVDGVDVATLSERARTLLRRRRLGFVFQSFNLIPVLSARENVEYPLLIDGTSRRTCTERALEMLAAVGLAERARHRPDQLSGGEQQRVAIARALVHRPQAVLADEPTGFLDSATAGSVMEMLERLNRDLGVTVVLATHDPVLIARAPRRVLLRDGLVTADGPPEAPS